MIDAAILLFFEERMDIPTFHENLEERILSFKFFFM